MLNAFSIRGSGIDHVFDKLDLPPTFEEWLLSKLESKK
jgi:hypothetical protein